MCEPDVLDSAASDLDEKEQSVSEALDTNCKIIPCPWCATVLDDGDLEVHLKSGTPMTGCKKIHGLLWKGSRSVTNELSQLMGLPASAAASSSKDPRLDAEGLFEAINAGLVAIKSAALDVPMFVVPRTIARLMWSWANYENPDAEDVTKSHMSKLKHLNIIEDFKNLGPDYKPAQFFLMTENAKGDKNWRPLNEWIFDHFLGAEYVFFKLENVSSGQAGDSVLVVLTMSKKIVCVFDPKSMTLSTKEKDQRDKIVFAAVHQLLAFLTKRFHGYLLAEQSRRWDQFMERPLTRYVYASAWLEDLVQRLTASLDPLIFELLVMAFYYRCAVQSGDFYLDLPEDKVPRFFLKSVEEMGILLENAFEDDKISGVFWKLLIEWALTKNTYEGLAVGANAGSPLLQQGGDEGKTFMAPTGLQTPLPHQVRLVQLISSDHAPTQESSPESPKQKPKQNGRPVPRCANPQNGDSPKKLKIGKSRKTSTAIKAKSIVAPRIRSHSRSTSQPPRKSNGNKRTSSSVSPSRSEEEGTDEGTSVKNGLVTAEQNGGDSMSEVEIGSYKCLCGDCCGFVSGNLPDMKDHVREHLNMRPYSCYHCQNRFTCLRTLKVHADVLGIELLKCPKCDYKSGDENKMHRHLQDEHFDVPKCRKEDLVGVLKIYEAHRDIKPWTDYIGSV